MTFQYKHMSSSGPCQPSFIFGSPNKCGRKLLDRISISITSGEKDQHEIYFNTYFCRIGNRFPEMVMHNSSWETPQFMYFNSAIHKAAGVKFSLTHRYSLLHSYRLQLETTEVVCKNEWF